MQGWAVDGPGSPGRRSPTAAGAISGYNLARNVFMACPANHHLRFGAECWIGLLVCPRRFLALLPSHSRPNLFSGD